jgi:hypothetical protein
VATGEEETERAKRQMLRMEGTFMLVMRCRVIWVPGLKKIAVGWKGVVGKQNCAQNDI